MGLAGRLPRNDSPSNPRPGHYPSCPASQPALLEAQSRHSGRLVGVLGPFDVVITGRSRQQYQNLKRHLPRRLINLQPHLGTLRSSMPPSAARNLLSVLSPTADEWRLSSASCSMSCLTRATVTVASSHCLSAELALLEILLNRSRYATPILEPHGPRPGLHRGQSG